MNRNCCNLECPFWQYDEKVDDWKCNYPSSDSRIIDSQCLLIKLVDEIKDIRATIEDSKLDSKILGREDD